MKVLCGWKTSVQVGGRLHQERTSLKDFVGEGRGGVPSQEAEDFQVRKRSTFKSGSGGLSSQIADGIGSLIGGFPGFSTVDFVGKQIPQDFVSKRGCERGTDSRAVYDKRFGSCL